MHTERWSVVAVCGTKCEEQAIDLKYEDAKKIANNLNARSCSYTVYMIRKDKGEDYVRD